RCEPITRMICGGAPFGVVNSGPIPNSPCSQLNFCYTRALLDESDAVRYRKLSGLPRLSSAASNHEGFMKFSTQRPYIWLFGLLAVVGLVGDQASKYVVFAKLYPPETKYTIIPGLFELKTSYLPISDPGDEPLSFLRTLSGDRLPH